MQSRYRWVKRILRSVLRPVPFLFLRLTWGLQTSTNNFLDQANEDLFKPRGLYCLIMSLRPDDVPKDSIGVESVDTSSAALKWLGSDKASFRAKAAKFRDSSGITHGDVEMPETAPLIYPDTGYAELGRMKSATGKQVGEFSTYQKVVGNYFDKRAQAKYVRSQFILENKLFFGFANQGDRFLSNRHTSTLNPPSPRKKSPNSLPNTATRLTHPSP